MYINNNNNNNNNHNNHNNNHINITILLTLYIYCYLKTMSINTLISSGTSSSLLLAPHPRLLLNDIELAKEIENSLKDEVRLRLHKRIISSALLELDTLPVEYILDRHHRKHGPDIKKQARTATPRILSCSMAYRLTKDKRFMDRAVAEMKSLANFPNWHPTLFLGTSEISTAVAIGYDWLYNDMNDSDRDIIANSLFKHCLSMGPAVYRMILNDSDSSLLTTIESSQLAPIINSAITRIGGEDKVYEQCGDGGVGIDEFARNVPWVTKHNNW